MPLMTEIPENWREPAARMVTSLRGLNRVLVAAHVNPDGDALGRTGLSVLPSPALHAAHQP